MLVETTVGELGLKQKRSSRDIPKSGAKKSYLAIDARSGFGRLFELEL
jgi:hypothetical protein